jgi:hypothetical protein
MPSWNGDLVACSTLTTEKIRKGYTADLCNCFFGFEKLKSVIQTGRSLSPHYR